MQPQTTNHGHSGESACARSAVQIRQQAIAELQIPAANRLDLRVVQFAGIRKRGTVVATNFSGSGFAGVPAPREAKLPRTAVAAEKRAERAELDPA